MTLRTWPVRAVSGLGVVRAAVLTSALALAIALTALAAVRRDEAGGR